MDLLRPLASLFGATSNHESNTNPKRSKNKIPKSLKPRYVYTTLGSMVALAIAIEIALFFSKKHHGFSLSKNAERLQWLSGFLPTLAIGPLVWIWKRTDKDLKKMQPYVVLSQGPATADQSLLLDLEHTNVFETIETAYKNGYLLILGSTAIALVNILLHPLAGSFFIVRQSKTTQIPDTFVHSTATIGLNPSYKDITSFVAAAGFADAAAFHNLSDPPFVLGSWAVAEFKFPLDVTRNSTIAVSTVGVQTNASCSAAGTLSLTPPTPASPLNLTLTASLPERGPNCTATQSIDSTAATSQYGVVPVLGCAEHDASRQPPFAPVLFWFYNKPVDGVPVASAVFCSPRIAAYEVLAVVDGASGLLVNVSVTGDVDQNSNNVTQGDFAGKAFNGISFDSDSDFNLTDRFVQARAIAVRTGLPGAIFRFASDPDQGGGLTAVFASATGFPSFTQKVYTQYMSIVALSNYFVPQDTPLEAKLTLWPNRLWINPISAHSMVALLILVAIVGGAVHYLHRRQRKRVYLASRPGSIAHYMGVLSDPHLAALMSKDEASRDQEGSIPAVGPLDNAKIMRRKLKGVRFTLDANSGGVVPVFSEGDAERRRASVSASVKSPVGSWSDASGYGVGLELEDQSKALLGPEYKVEPYRDPFDRKGG